MVGVRVCVLFFLFFREHGSLVVLSLPSFLSQRSPQQKNARVSGKQICVLSVFLVSLSSLFFLRSQEGAQFERGFGGLGGILRYRVDFQDYDEVVDAEDDFI